jgi:hypothetical protein
LSFDAVVGVAYSLQIISEGIKSNSSDSISFDRNLKRLYLPIWWGVFSLAFVLLRETLNLGIPGNNCEKWESRKNSITGNLISSSFFQGNSGEPILFQVFLLGVSILVTNPQKCGSLGSPENNCWK